MTGNQLRRQYLTLLEAVDNILEPTGSEEEDIFILPPLHGDSYATDVEEDNVDESHKNNLLKNDVAGTLEVHKHNNNQSKVASDVPAVQREENKWPPKKKRKIAEAVAWKKKTSLKEIPEATAVHLADSHPHLALLEPVALFRLLEPVARQ